MNPGRRKEGLGSPRRALLRSRSTSLRGLLLVLSVFAFPAVSALKVCPLTSNRVVITNFYRYVYATSEANMTVIIRSKECHINSSVVAVVPDLSEAHFDDAGRPWHEFGFIIDETELTINLGEHAGGNLTFSRAWEDLALCSSVGLEFTFPPLTRIARNCTGEDDAREEEEAPRWKNNCTHVTNTMLTDFSNDLDDPRVQSPGYNGGHIIFIPLGAIVFVVTVCLRFCLCPKRGSTASPRNVSSVTRQLSLNSDASDSLTTMHYDLDLPPAYSDLQTEDTPPPYSEVEKVKIPPYEDPPPPFGRLYSSTALQIESETPQNTSCPPSTAADTSSTSLADSSGLVKVLTARTLQSQFSHKPLEEEKPAEQA
ncbi:uncharacterized protein LOC134766522 [Penaeus indicus]|uniref:uncharacterized protein LOC134766522 n=1 Tax=Penaeus indicus TaxID=29960 RepID=UPI00300D23DF